VNIELLRLLFPRHASHQIIVPYKNAVLQ
jgi:hypothetical protein